MSNLVHERSGAEVEGGVRSGGARSNSKPRAQVSPPDSAVESAMRRGLRRRRYRHFDRPLSCNAWKPLVRPDYVQRHAWSPLIHWHKEVKRYKRTASGSRVIDVKRRPLCCASHKDAAILSFYALQLSAIYERRIFERKISDHICAYRALGKSNYDFAADVLREIRRREVCQMRAYDVTSFFDTLDHGILKDRLRGILGEQRLPEDWYAIFKFVTRYKYIEKKDLEDHPVFGLSFLSKAAEFIAPISEVIRAGITVHANPCIGAGIPQGTPISAVLANVYMINFDESMAAFCAERRAFYRRYSDDIVVICDDSSANEVELEITRLLRDAKLEINVSKTEVSCFKRGRRISGPGEYLGFMFSEDTVGLRSSTLGRQWRKMKRAIRRAEHKARGAANNNCPGKLYTRKLRKRFLGKSSRSFSSYGRRGAKAFDGSGSRIRRQVARLERAAEARMRAAAASLQGEGPAR